MALKSALRALAAPTDITTQSPVTFTPCSRLVFSAMASRQNWKPALGMYPWKFFSRQRATFFSMDFFTSSGGSKSGFPMLKSKTLSFPYCALSFIPSSNILRITPAPLLVIVSFIDVEIGMLSSKKIIKP